MSVTAWAYWASNGLGSAAAVGGGFDPAVLAPPAVSNGTVSLTWTAAPPPGSGSVGYSVERRLAGTEDWNPACATTPTIHTVATSCSEVPGDGTWEWQVIAYFHSWTATSDESDAVNVDDPDTAPPTGEVTAPSSNTAVRGVGHGVV